MQCMLCVLLKNAQEITCAHWRDLRWLQGCRWHWCTTVLNSKLSSYRNYFCHAVLRSKLAGCCSWAWSSGGLWYAVLWLRWPACLR